MHVDLHPAMRQIIDKSLLGEASIHEQQTLQEHLASCALCQDYLVASNRVIAGLAGFSFEADPELQARVMDSLILRAQQLQSSQRRPMWWNYLTALVLTAAGSFTVTLFTPASLRAGVFALWILPSLCFCLLFPVLHRLSTGEKGLLQ